MNDSIHTCLIDSWIAPPGSEEEDGGRFVDESIELDRKTDDLLRRCEALVGKKEQSSSRAVMATQTSIEQAPVTPNEMITKTPPKGQTPEDLYYLSPGTSIDEDNFRLPVAQVASPTVVSSSPTLPFSPAHRTRTPSPQRSPAAFRSVNNSASPQNPTRKESTENTMETYNDATLLRRAEAFVNDDIVAGLVAHIHKLEADLLFIRHSATEHQEASLSPSLRKNRGIATRPTPTMPPLLEKNAFLPQVTTTPPGKRL